MKKERSALQKARQSDEYRNKGKYSAVNRCEICNNPTQVNYCSHSLYGSPEFGANGSCLCDPCADATFDMKTKEEYLEYKNNFKRKKKS